METRSIPVSHPPSTFRLPVPNSIPLLSFYTLPLETGTLCLSRKTLQGNTAFKFSKQSYPVVNLRKLSFQNEVLTLGIRLAQEPEERVYIQVKQNILLVSCSVDTSSSYLSRYAYFALHQLFSVYDHYDFSNYYWPDFFDRATGQSKYLDIINDRAGMDISLKPEYPAFFKPGQKLFHPCKETNAVPTPIKSVLKDLTSNTIKGSVIGFCLADAMRSNIKDHQFPMLLPYYGQLTATGKTVKEFFNYIQPNDTEQYGYTAMQFSINQISKQMRALNSLICTDSKNSKTAYEKDRTSNLKKLFVLWQQVIPLLAAQPYTHFFDIFCDLYIDSQPKKKRMIPCGFSTETPEICFLWTEKDGHYELELLFKVAGQTFSPHLSNPSFFIRTNTEPLKFYLLNSLDDYHLLCYFACYKFKLAILKTHYDVFKHSFESLYALYPVRMKKLVLHKPVQSPVTFPPATILIQYI